MNNSCLRVHKSFFIDKVIEDFCMHWILPTTYHNNP